MGMDYLPVYAGDEDADEKIVKLSPGRIQRSGVRSELVTRQAISRTDQGAWRGAARRAPRVCGGDPLGRLRPGGRAGHDRRPRR